MVQEGVASAIPSYTPMQLVIYKLKKNKVSVWKDWLQELNITYRKEAIKTFEEEGLLFEYWSVFESNGNFYTVGCNYKFKDGEVSDCKLNRLHKEKKKECFSGKVAMEDNLLLIQ